MQTAEQETVFTTVDITKYNGALTVYNPATKDHRTFKISTAQKGGLKGKRILSLLVGPDNENSYQGFAFVNDKGGIKVWTKHRRPNYPKAEKTVYEKFADILERSEHYQEKFGLEYKFSVCCRKCNKQLTDPESIDLGIGPVCREKM